MDEFEDLQDQWDLLAERFRSPLFEHDWFAAAARSVHTPEQLRVHVVRQEGRLVAAAPLVMDPSRGRLTLIGGMKLYEPSGWLFATDTAGFDLARACLRSGNCLLLQRIPAALRDILADALHGRALVFNRAHPPSHGVETAGRWDDYADRLSKHLRRSLRNLESRASRDVGPRAFTVHAPGPDEIAPLFEELMRVEHSGWKGRAGSSLTTRADLRAFFADYARRAARRGRLRVAELRFGSRTAAMELAVEAHRRWWSLKIGYDESLAALSPSIQLTHASIKAAFERGLESYEFLGVAEPWQERWLPTRRDYGLAAIYPFGVRGARELARDAWHSLGSKRRTNGS